MFVLLRKRRLIPAAFFCGFLLLPLLLWAGLSIYPVQTFGVENGEARVVIIDPGHGGEDGGAVADDGTEESGINLAVSLRLEGIFRFLGVPTEMTWIACGETKIDLPRACEILAEQFGVERMAVVGGGHINAGFLAADLLDEVSVLIGAGIDGRGGMPAVFDGLPVERPVTELKLNSVRQYGSGAVWLRYAVKK